MTLGERIEQLRNDRNLSQKELAAKLDMPTGSVAEFESDEKIPSAFQLAQLSGALRVSMDRLLAGVDNVSDPLSAASGPEIPGCLDRKRKKTKEPKGKRFGKVVLLCCIPLLLAAALVGGFFAAKHFEQTPFLQDTVAIAEAEKSVVKIVCCDYYGDEVRRGSGFLLFNDQTVITNYHVIDGVYSCTVYTGQEVALKTHKVLAYSEEQDIAILELDKPSGITPLQTGQSTLVQKGESVLAIGSPLGITNTVSTGILSGRTEADSVDMLQFTAAISAGSSGGALFNDAGEVIGVTSGAYEAGQSLNLAVPIEKVTKLYDQRGKSTTVAKLHETNYAYKKYLRDYEDAKAVSLDALIENENAYGGDTVIIYGYIAERDVYLNELCLVADESECGSECTWSNRKRHIKVDPDGAIFCDYALEEGEFVCVIGKVPYEASMEIKADLVFRTEPE